MFIGNINTIPSIVNLPGQGTSGPGGAAFKFRNNQGGWFEPVNSSSQLGVINDLAISCWIKVTDVSFFDPLSGVNFKEAHIVDKLSSNKIAGYRLLLKNNGEEIPGVGGTIQLVFQATTQGTSGITTIAVTLPTSGQNEIKANTVYLVTAQCGGGNAAIRLRGANGVSINKTQSNFASPNPGTGFPVFVIGNGNPTSPQRGFPGLIDEVALWPTATIIDSNGADNLFNWPIYKDLMNSNPLGNNIQPDNWFRMGEDATKEVDPGTGNERWTLPNKGSANTSEVLKSDAEGTLPLPEKVVPGLPNELYA